MYKRGAFMARKNYEYYRQEISVLDAKIARCEDNEEKIKLIDEDIKLNKEYIHLLRRVIPVKIVFCVILSFAFLLGLIIFLPQIIVRKTKINTCLTRIRSLEEYKKELTK